MNETRLQQPRVITVSVVPLLHVLLRTVKWFFKNMGCSKCHSLRLARYFSRSLREKFLLALAHPITRSLLLALTFASGSSHVYRKRARNTNKLNTSY